MDKEEIMAEIQRLRDSGKLVIVEGKKDKKALSELGIVNVVTLNKPLYIIVEEVAEQHKEAVLLTDLDAEGKKLFGELSRGLQRLGVRVDKRFRNYLLRKTGVRQVEGLATYVENLI